VSRDAEILPASEPLDRFRQGKILRRSLHVRSRERSGILARARFAVCRGRLILHGNHVIDYNRLGFGEQAMTLVGWVTTTLTLLWRGALTSRDAATAREASNP
jgi:hypothetical protein